MQNQGAVFGAKFGWERPNWFAKPNGEQFDQPSFGKPNWFDRVAEECFAIRNRVALVDQTSFFKLEVSGSDALATLDYLATCRVDQPVGTVIYTQMCNSRGGIECDVVILRVATECFWVYSGSGFGVHDLDWIETNTPKEFIVRIRDITDDYAVINICGPCSRPVLKKVVQCDVSKNEFPYMTLQSSSIGRVPVVLARLEYSGELGWEITVGKENALDVYRQLVEAGQEFGIINAGFRALESLCLENRYLYWSGEISPYINPYEVDLDFRIAKAKAKFIGKDALQQIGEQGPVRRLYCFHTDEYVPIYGGEPIVCNDQMIAHTVSGGYGFSTEQSICYAFLNQTESLRDPFYLQTIDRSIPVKPRLAPLYRRDRSA